MYNGDFLRYKIAPDSPIEGETIPDSVLNELVSPHATLGKRKSSSTAMDCFREQLDSLTVLKNGQRKSAQSFI